MIFLDGKYAIINNLFQQDKEIWWSNSIILFVNKAMIKEYFLVPHMSCITYILPATTT